MTLTMELWHGSTLPRAKLEAGLDGGLHLGTREQALMRSPVFLHRIAVTIRQGAVRKSRDNGGGWASKIADARKAGLDAICYVNRYEGLSPEVVDRINSRNLDSLPDSKFLKAVPEADISWIILHPQDARVVEIQAGPGRMSLFHTCPPEKADKLLAEGFQGEEILKLCSDPEAVWQASDRTRDATILSVRVSAEHLQPNPKWCKGSWLDIAKSEHPWYLQTELPIPSIAFRRVADLEMDRSPTFG
mgnify:CR=1 FL=1